jgi:putative transposase
LRQPDTTTNIKELRNLQYIVDENHWSLSCPQRIREHALQTARNAVGNAKKKFKTTGKVQQVSFRKKKDNRQFFGFDTVSIKIENGKGKIFSGKDNQISFRLSEDLQQKDLLQEGCRIWYDTTLKHWYLLVPQEIPIKKPETQRFLAVSIDPGVRTFVTYFSPECSGYIGDGDFNKITRLCHSLDMICSKISKLKGKENAKKKSSHKRAKARIINKIKNLLQDIHKKTASFLVKNFDNIIIPTYNAMQMAIKVNSKVARSLLNWATGKFFEFLKFKAKEYSCNIIQESEAYTSKCCSYCGTLHNIGSKKVLRCSCGATVHRDGNGARGFMLRALMALRPSV